MSTPLGGEEGWPFVRLARNGEEEAASRGREDDMNAGARLESAGISREESAGMCPEAEAAATGDSSIVIRQVHWQDSSVVDDASQFGTAIRPLEVLE